MITPLTPLTSELAKLEFKIEYWLYFKSDPVGQTKRQYGRMITVESATKVMEMAM